MVGGVTPPPADLHQLVVKCVDVLKTVFRMFGFDEANYKTAPTVDHHLQCVRRMNGNWMKFYKYKIAAFYAAAEFEQELPICPPEIADIDKPDAVLGGKAYMWFKMLMRTKTVKARQLALSILYSKKGFPRASEEELKEGAYKTFITLTTQTAALKESTVRGERVTQEELFDAIDRICGELFTGQQFTVADQMEPFFPSTSANYNNSRTEAGTVGTILEHPSLLQGLKGPERLIDWEVRSGRSGKVPYLQVDRTKLDEKFAELYGRCLEASMKEEPLAVPVALAEALKIRVITKGPPLANFVLKPFQRWMWKILRTRGHGTFDLIGETITPEYLMRQVGMLRADEQYLSGDLTAATDNFFSAISNYIVERVGHYAKLEPNLVAKVKQSLTGHKIVNPKDKKDIRSQETGQLMGAIASFCFLNIGLGGVCLVAREASVGRRLTLKTANMAINGDDHLLRLTRRGKAKWEAGCMVLGPAPSVGKSYYSREFVNMNSTRYSVERSTAEPPAQGLLMKDPEGLSWVFVQSLYINLGLMFGLKRSAKSTEKTGLADWATLQSVGANATALVQGAPVETQELVFETYLNHNWKMLTSTSLPWYLPEHLGGLGLPSIGIHKPSDKDLRVAAVVYNHYKMPKRAPKVAWKTWKVATERLGKISNVTNITSEFGGGARDIADETTLLGLLCVEALFRVKGIKDLFDDGKTADRQGLNAMEKVWRKACRDARMSTTQPFSADSLPNRAIIEESRLIQIAARFSDVPPTLLGGLPLPSTAAQNQTGVVASQVSRQSGDSNGAYDTWLADEEPEWL